MFRFWKKLLRVKRIHELITQASRDSGYKIQFLSRKTDSNVFFFQPFSAEDGATMTIMEKFVAQLDTAAVKAGLADYMDVEIITRPVYKIRVKVLE